MKFALVFLVTFMTVAINLPDHMIKGMGIDPKYLMAALAAWVFAGLLSNTKMMMFVMVLLVAAMANMPDKTLEGWGIDRLYLLVTLLCIAISPLLMKPPSR